MKAVKRKFCRDSNHPEWRAWEAVYDMSNTSWKFISCECIYCGQIVTQPVSNPKVKKPFKQWSKQFSRD